MNDKVSLEDIVSLCKRRGFVYQGSEIYGGLSGTWDYGPLGVMLKQNIQNVWWEHFVRGREDIYPIDSAILMNSKVWQASGHVSGFNDPLVVDVKTQKRYRADHLLEENGVDPKGMSLEKMSQTIKGKSIKSPDGNELSEATQFNMMFKTQIGVTGGEESSIYLRPETAQGIFTNFKNIVDTFNPDMPFGIAQIGKAFRNEISPRDFIFRDREMEMMEIEYFINPGKVDWNKLFDYWLGQQKEYFEHIGIDTRKVHQYEHPDEDRSHYSKKTVDWEFEFPFGQKELTGLAYRTDFDLQAHIKHSGKNLMYRPKDGSESFVPHVLEPTFGVERHVLAVLTSAYTEDEINGEKRVFLKLPAHLAPVIVAVFPLLKNKPELVKKAREIYEMLKKNVQDGVMPGLRSFGEVAWDDNGNIGKRYRRQDEIGTPYCVTVDFDSLQDNTLTLRNRDTTEQERVKIDDLISKL